MTIHAPNSPSYAFRCTTPGCRCVRAGYPSQSAAAHAEAHHIEQAHPTRKAAAR